MEEYPAITLWQPWATLVAAGAKPFEFRSWAPPASKQGRRIAIHAAARKPSMAELRELMAQLAGPDWRLTGLVRGKAMDVLGAAWSDLSVLPLSAVVCLATLGKPIRNEELAQALELPAVNDSDRDEHSNWGWPLSDIERLEPYAPARGQQGWWTWRR